MKLETLFKRLASRTNYPELENVLLGEGDLPVHCLVWTGATFGSTPRKTFKVNKTKRDGLTMHKVDDKPFGIMQWQGKVIAVRRLIFLLLMKPNYEFRMWNDCGNTLCVNPHHYTVTEVSPEPHIPEIEAETAGFPEDEAAELVEMVLLKSPKSWEELIEDVLLEEVPEEMVRDYLREIKRENLL